MTVRLFFDRIFFCVSIALLASCSQSQKEASQEKITDAVEGTNDLRVDTNNADITLENFLQVKPGQAGDSLYRNFISGLIKVHKFNASVEHLKAYYGAFNKTADQKSFALMRLGEVYNALAQYELAIKYFRDALEVNLKAGDSARAAECEHSIGYNLQLTGDLAQSIEHIYKALKFYEQKNDSDNICIAFFDIAESYYRQENFTKAFEFYKHCHDYYRGKADTFQLAQALTYLCDVQHKLNLNDDALRDGNAAIALWKHLADAEGEANCLNTMAGIYFDQKKYEDAIKFYKEAYDLVMTTEFQRPLPVLMMNLGVCYTNTGSYPIAEKYLLSSIEELKKAGMVSELQLAYRHASVLYKKLDMPEKALRNYEQFDSIQNILAEKQSSESIERLNLKYETAKAQNEIMELSREKKHTETKERIFILVTAIVLLLLAMVITIILLRNRQRRKNLETEKAMKELELSKAKLKHENDRKLMDDFAQRILDKNKLITDLEKKIKSAPGFNSSTETARKSLEELSKLKILTNDDWDKFQMNYNKIFPGIIKSVLTASPELTEAELRMFLLIKLGISIREVATVLGISQESVRKTRYRMRKKLNIGEYDDLDEFVKNFRPPEVSQVQPSS